MKKTFIFDYDDTLAWNQDYYSWAQLKFAEFVMSQIGPRTPNIQEIINLEVAIDMDLTKKMGFSQDRFPHSFQLTYQQIRQKLGLEEDIAGQQQAFKLGTTAFSEEEWRKRGLVEGAEETLDFLAAQGDNLLILTKGEYDVQRRKLEATRCSRWFGGSDEGRVHIVSDKKPETFEAVVIGKWNRDYVWAVGNSAKSDIIPALNANLKAIYIPQETWAYEKYSDSEFLDNPRLVIFDNIIRIKEKYDSLK